LSGPRLATIKLLHLPTHRSFTTIVIDWDNSIIPDYSLLDYAYNIALRR
jgi:hypothetical protein